MPRLADHPDTYSPATPGEHHQMQAFRDKAARERQRVLDSAWVERRTVKYRSRIHRWTCEQVADVLILPLAWAENRPRQHESHPRKRRAAE